MPVIQLEPVVPTDRAGSLIVAEILRGAPNAHSIAEHLQAVVKGQLAMYDRTKAVTPWIGYLARDEQTRQLLGSCSFIGTPEAGSVEIAYFTFPPYEGRGVATAMAEKLVAIALSAGNPDLHAFTLPHENPSTSVLGKLGFRVAGEAEDEDAGVVWRWERRSQIGCR